MLRQALDDAEKGERQRLQAAAQASDERTSLINATTTGAAPVEEATSGSLPKFYGAVAGDSNTSSRISLLYDEGVEDHDPSDDDEDEEDESDDDESEVVEHSLLARAWDSVKTFFKAVADVENLWDSPTSTESLLRGRRDVDRRRRTSVVLFWFVVLAVSYASERSTFKLLVDFAGPFRLVAVQMVTATHAILLLIGIFLSKYIRLLLQQPPSDRSNLRLGIPYIDVGLIALLDTITIVLVFVTGSHVPPTLTVILVQFQIPLTAFLTQFIHPDGKFAIFCRNETSDHEDTSELPPDTSHHSQQQHNNAVTMLRDSNPDHRHHVPSPPMTIDPANTTTAAADNAPLPGWGGLAAPHLWGSLILFLAVLLALCPAFYAIADPDFFNYADTIPSRTAVNTLFYACACIPAAASQLYKEHIFLQYKQPVNMDQLNLLLSVFQFLFASIASPMAYGLQGLGVRGDWTKLYPSADFSENFIDSLKCFFGLLDEDDMLNKYWEDADCRYPLVLVFTYTFSIIAVGVAVDKIVNAGATKVMYRGISAGIILAVLSMQYYDIQIPDFSYGPAIDALNLLCLVLLIIGAEVYHRASLQESTFETEYPQVVVPTFEEY